MTNIEYMSAYTHVVWGGGGHFVQTPCPGIYRGRLVNQENHLENVPGVFFFFYLLCNQVNRWFFEQFSRLRCMDITFNYSHKLNVKNKKFNKWKTAFYKFPLTDILDDVDLFSGLKKIE